MAYLLFFFNHTPTTEIYTLSLHDALPISRSSELPRSPSAATSPPSPMRAWSTGRTAEPCCPTAWPTSRLTGRRPPRRSEEHTSELQSRVDLVCRLLLEKKKKKKEQTQETQ